MCEAHNHDAAEPADESGAHDHGTHDHGTAAGAHDHDVAVVDSETAECLVMRGNYVDKAEAEAAGLVREHEGTKYYLCCAACGPLFDADPTKYAAAA
ncbi:hypothetical protein AA0Z99_05770 [Agrococcus sp. 1P02AA]|uniref:hypothetical protein n=1 Tax=Agrococcus sp. 1P02AA TaxID=3132259 RepID=UPI0039A564A5